MAVKKFLSPGEIFAARIRVLGEDRRGRFA
jgi:hypothetical protein